MKKLILLITLFSNLAFSQQAMFDICPIKTGQEMPEAQIFDKDGGKVDLKNYVGDKTVVVVFYRGAWCPYCTRQLSALSEIKPKLDNLGVELIAISADDYTKIDSSYTRSGTDDYTLFSDKNISAINAFGIGWKVDDDLYQKYKNQYGMDTEWWSGSKHHVLPVPAIFVIEKGVIKHQYVNPNYSKRLSPKVLLSFVSEE
ncbi:AhpC/TSA family protein [Flavobacteriales bacterium]|nr:AhpC/TSA family protein [Flavobacteriales bacterium]